MNDYDARAAHLAGKMCNGKCVCKTQKHSTADYDVCPVARYWEQEGFHKYMKMYGKHFSEKLAKWVVEQFVNVDGSSGQHWSCTQVEEALAAMGYNVHPEHRYDAYYLANMAYSDHFNRACKTEAQCLQYVIDVLEDKDGYPEMAFDIWSAKAMGKCQEVHFDKFV